MLGPVTRAPTCTPGSVESVQYGFGVILDPEDYDEIATVVPTWSDAQRKDAEAYIYAELCHQVEGIDRPVEPEFIRTARSGSPSIDMGVVPVLCDDGPTVVRGV
jgi:hypothetical protein